MDENSIFYLICSEKTDTSDKYVIQKKDGGIFAAIKTSANGWFFPANVNVDNEDWVCDVDKSWIWVLNSILNPRARSDKFIFKNVKNGISYPYNDIFEKLKIDQNSFQFCLIKHKLFSFDGKNDVFSWKDKNKKDLILFKSKVGEDGQRNSFEINIRPELLNVKEKDLLIAFGGAIMILKRSWNFL